MGLSVGTASTATEVPVVPSNQRSIGSVDDRNLSLTQLNRYRFHLSPTAIARSERRHELLGLTCNPRVDFRREVEHLSTAVARLHHSRTPRLEHRIWTEADSAH